MGCSARRVATVFGEIDVLEAGSGPILLVLHRDCGRGEWGEWAERLTEHFRVVMPSLPGFDASDRIEWLRSVSDLAAVMGAFIGEIATPVDIVGLGFGAWLGAEIAARDPSRVGRMFLHAPMGVKPPQGEIADFVLWETLAFLRLGFERQDAYDALIARMTEAMRDNWENNREIVMRLAWKPAMYDPALIHLLPAIASPVRVAWSIGDAIVPRSAALAYADALPSGSYVEIASGGHHAEIETPDLLADAVIDFLVPATGARAVPQPAIAE